jgi:hypothetical protein
MTSLPISELERLPYVDTKPTDGRQVLLQKSYFDAIGGEWHLYFTPTSYTIGRMAGGETVYGSYFAQAAADPTQDVELAISTLVTQHLSFPALIPRLGQFEHDVQNCAAVLEKYHLLANLGARGEYTTILITTELEYLFTLVRSMYDLLHQIVRETAPLFITLNDVPERVVKNRLPDSFADVALRGDARLTGDEIVVRRKLPPALANWYVREAPAFQLLRKIRDAIVHRGEHRFQVYDIPEKGLAVANDETPWSDLAIWQNVEPVNKRLVPLRLAFVEVVNHVLGASERLAQTICSFTRLPPPIGLNVRVFLRSAVAARLLEIPSILRHP